MEIMPNYVIFLTNRCNLKCPHCFWENGVRDQSLSKKDLKRILKNLPNGRSFNILLTGGEITLEKDLLIYGLEELKKIRKRKGVINLEVQTNGSWLKDDEETYNLFEKFYELGVNNVQFASNDQFHRTAGFDIRKRQHIIDKAEKRFKKRMQVWGVYAESDLYKRGRAVENFPDSSERCQYPLKYEKPTRYSVGDELRQPRFYIFPDGNLNICESGIPTPLGSAIENSIATIERKMSEEHQAFIWKGISSVLTQRGLHLEGYEEHPCSCCRELYKD